MSWSLGDWDKGIDSLTVSFITDNRDAPLRFANGEGGSEHGLELSVVRLNVSSDVSFHVLENSTDICSVQYDCTSLPSAVIVLWIVLGVIGFMVVCLPACVWLISKCDGDGDSYVGYLGGGYGGGSGCGGGGGGCGGGGGG